jgi:hypothetical protein
MIGRRQSEPGTTRTCPHCRETILDSAVVCPVCRKHLRFDSRPATARTGATFSPLRVEGTFVHPSDAEPCEYTVFATVSNERGEEIERRVLGVGALQPGERRTFAIGVEIIGGSGG